MSMWLDGKVLSKRPKNVIQYRRASSQYILQDLGKMHLQEIRPAYLNQCTWPGRKRAGLRVVIAQCCSAAIQGAL